MQALKIVVLSMLACIFYGILHDQVTARICVEYFTVGHAPIFNTEDPTLLGLGWGVIATWWVGVFLGVPLAAFARIGHRPKCTAVSLIRPITVLMVSTGILAMSGGFVALLAASMGWISLDSEIAARLPADRHTPFLVDFWIHNTSYASGLVGGVFLMGWVCWKRIRMDAADAR